MLKQCSVIHTWVLFFVVILNFWIFGFIFDVMDTELLICFLVTILTCVLILLYAIEDIATFCVWRVYTLMSPFNMLMLGIV